MTRMVPLLLRADADSQIGVGHLVRLMALGSAWRARGGQVLFLGGIASPAIQEQIRETGAEFVPVGRRHPHPDDLAIAFRCIAQMRAEAGPSGTVWTAIDGRHFDADYQTAIRAFGSRLLVIDDLAEAEHYDADLVLNPRPEFDERQYSGCVGPDTTLLLGTRYALLRPKFTRYRPLRTAVPEVARRVLIAFGGPDPLDLSSKTLSAIERVSYAKLHVRVLVGAANPKTASLRARARASGGQVELVDHSSDWAGEMAWADVVIAPAGEACWELACMKVPALVTAITPGQIPLARSMAQAGAMVDLGPARLLTAQRIATALTSLCFDAETRARQIEVAHRLVDGAGAARVMAVMRALDGELAIEDVALRPLEPTDCWPLWRTKPDLSPETTTFSTDPIPPDEHRRWFGEKLADDSTRIWVLALHGLIVGAVRYDRVDDSTAEISFHVVRSCRRRGLGTRLIAETCDRARAELGIEHLRAVVRTDNEASARVFLNIGFQEVTRRKVQGRDCLILEQLALPDVGASVPPLRLFEPRPTTMLQEADCRRLG